MQDLYSRRIKLRRRRWKVCKNSCRQIKKNRYSSKQVEPAPLRNQRRCRKRSRSVKEGTLALLVLSGLSDKWWREAMECFCFSQDKLADRKSPYERRIGTPFDRPRKPFGAEIYLNPISTKDKSRLHQVGTKTLPRIFIGYALTSRGGWTRDLIIADWHDIENCVASEVHMKKIQAQRQELQETI